MKKIIAPIIIAVSFIGLFCIGLVYILSYAHGARNGLLLIGVLLALIIGIILIIKVLIERIKEIVRGVEDDLGQY